MAADSLKIDFDSGLRPRIVNGVARFHRYQDQIQEFYSPPPPFPPYPQLVRLISNPESKVQFVKRMFAETAMGWVVAAEEAEDHAAVPRRTKPQIT